jgi:hypothetical protein
MNENLNKTSIQNALAKWIDFETDTRGNMTLKNEFALAKLR